MSIATSVQVPPRPGHERLVPLVRDRETQAEGHRDGHDKSPIEARRRPLHEEVQEDELGDMVAFHDEQATGRPELAPEAGQDLAGQHPSDGIHEGRAEDDRA